MKYVDDKKIQPVEPSGTVQIAGEQVEISPHTVQMKRGSSTKEILKGLREISKKALFTPPAFMANE